MEECEAAKEDIYPKEASTSDQQHSPEESIDEFIKKIVNDLVPQQSDNTSKRYAVDDVGDASDNGVSNETGVRPRGGRARTRYRTSLETIAEDRPAVTTTTTILPGSLVESAFSSHTLRLCDTTPSMIAMTSQTSVHSRVSAQTASLQTIFHTPDWADDDSDCKSTGKTDSSSRKFKNRTEQVKEAVSSGVGTEDKDSVDVVWKNDQLAQTPLEKLLKNAGLPAPKFQESPVSFDLARFDQLAANIQGDMTENARPAIEDLEKVFSVINEFDPLKTPAMSPPPPRQKDSNIHGCVESSAHDKSEATLQTSVVVMQFDVMQNAGLPEIRSDANNHQESLDFIQLGHLPANTKIEKVGEIEKENTSLTLEELQYVFHGLRKSEQEPKTYPFSSTTPADEQSPECNASVDDEMNQQPVQTPMQAQLLRNLEPQEFQENVDQLNENADLARFDRLAANIAEETTENEHMRSTINEIESVDNEIHTLDQSKDLPNSQSSLLSPDLKACDVSDDESEAILIDKANETGDQKQFEYTQQEQIQNSTVSETISQNEEKQPEDSLDLISFNQVKENVKASETEAGRKLPVNLFSQPIFGEMSKTGQMVAPPISPCHTENTEDTDSKYTEDRKEVQPGCLEPAKTFITLAQDQSDAFENELVETSSEIHQIKMSSSALLRDFYDMRKTYTNEFVLSSQIIARTVAERDPPADNRNGSKPESVLKSKRIDSAIDLMDATIDEIQKWQSRKANDLSEHNSGKYMPSVPHTSPENDVGKTANKETVVKKNNTPEFVRSTNAHSTASPVKGRPLHKPTNGSALKRDGKAPRVEMTRNLRPMTSHVPNRSLDLSGKLSTLPRKDIVLANQVKKPPGDSKSKFVPAIKRVQPVRPNTHSLPTKLEMCPSTSELTVSSPGTAAATVKVQTPLEKINELKACTLNPAAYLQRCLALTEIDVGSARRAVTLQDNAKPPVPARQVKQQAVTDKNVSLAAERDENVAARKLPTAKAKELTTTTFVPDPTPIIVPQKLVHKSKKDTNVALVVAAANEDEQENIDTKPKSRFLSDDDIEKWVRLSTRYTRCAEMGAAMFAARNSRASDKGSVKSDGSVAKTASDLLMDTLMNTVNDAIKKTSRTIRSKNKKGERPTSAQAAKAILRKLSDDDSRGLSQLQSDEKVARSIDNLVTSMSKIVDSRSDKRVCWDSSLDSLPAERDLDSDVVQEEIVEKSRKVVEKMTDTLIKHLDNTPDELDFKTADTNEPMTQLSADNVLTKDQRRRREEQKCAETLKRWSDTKSNQLETILSRLMQTRSTTSSWGFTDVDKDAIPDSVKSSRHKLATLDTIVALLSGLDKTCQLRSNNVEWDEDEYRRPPSMKPLPAKKNGGASKSPKGKSGNTEPNHVVLGEDECRRKFMSLSSLSSSQSSKSNKQKKLRHSLSNNTEGEKVKNQIAPPMGQDVKELRRKSQSPSARSVNSRQSDMRIERGLSAAEKPRHTHCNACNEKTEKEMSAKERVGRDANKQRRSLRDIPADNHRSKTSPPKVGDSRKTRSPCSDSSTGLDRSKSPRLSYCDTCDEKKRKEVLAKEKGEVETKNPKRSSSNSSEKRGRSQSPPARRASSHCSDSSNELDRSKSPRLSYCDTCDEKKRKEALAKENGEVETKNPRRSSSNSSEKRERSQSPPARRTSSQCSNSSNELSRRKPSTFSYCDACDEKRRNESLEKELKGSEAKQLRSSSNSSEKRGRSQSPPARRTSSQCSNSSNELSRRKPSTFSYCGACDEKRRNESLEKERKGADTKNPRRSSSTSSEKRDRLHSPPIRKASSKYSGSSNDLSMPKSSTFSYCDTCDKKRRYETRGKERKGAETKKPRHSSSNLSQKRDRSHSPPMRNASSKCSGFPNKLSRPKSPRLSYCDTCDKKRRKESLDRERKGAKTKNPRGSSSNSSAKSERSQTPPARRVKSTSSNSSNSADETVSKRPNYSFCGTFDKGLSRQTIPPPLLKHRESGKIGPWRADSSQDMENGSSSQARVSFSAPLEYFEYKKTSTFSPRYSNSNLSELSIELDTTAKERVHSHLTSDAKQNKKTSAPKEQRIFLRESSETRDRLLTPSTLDRNTDSLASNMSECLSRGSLSDNCSSRTFIFSERMSRPARYDLSLPKIRHVESTKSSYKHVLQKTFIDRLDNIIKVQSSQSRPSLASKPSSTSSTSMARYMLKKSELTSSDRYKMKHHIPAATEIRARIKRCCNRMPSKDIFGADISRESLTRTFERHNAESAQSFAFLDEVNDVEDFLQHSVSTAVCNKAFSTTYANVIHRDRPFLATTKISRKIQSFIKRDLNSWHKITNDCIENVKKDDNIRPFSAVPSTIASVSKSDIRDVDQFDETLIHALLSAIGNKLQGIPASSGSLDNVALITKQLRKNKNYRQKDNLEEGEIVIPIDDICSSETLLKTLRAVLKTDTEASLTPTESRSTEFDSTASTIDFEKECSEMDRNSVDQVLKTATLSSYSPSTRNIEIESADSTTDSEDNVAKISATICRQVLEKVAHFSYSPGIDLSSAESQTGFVEARFRGLETVNQELEKSEALDSDISMTSFVKLAEVRGSTSGEQEFKSAAESFDSSCGINIGMSSAETLNDSEVDQAVSSTDNSNATMMSESIHSQSELSHERLFSNTTEDSSESLRNMTDYEVSELKQEISFTMKGDLLCGPHQANTDSYCSLPEMLERLDMAIPFQHERLAVETISGTSMPMVNAVSEDTWERLSNAISHLPSEFQITGDEVFSRHQHLNLPPVVQADIDLYNECQNDESLHHSQKMSSRSRNMRDLSGMRQTKSLLTDKLHEPKVAEETRLWSEQTDGIVSACGDKDANDISLHSDGVSLIANASMENCGTESAADTSILNLSNNSSSINAESSASTSRGSLATTSEENVSCTENEILMSLLDKVNTRSQLDALNARLEGVVRREQLVEEVVDQRAVTWRGTSTISAICLTFSAVVAGAILGIPSLWE